MHGLKCMDCGSQIEEPKRLGKVRCGPCRVAYKRRDSRAYHQRERAALLATRPLMRTLTCVDCGGEWESSYTKGKSRCAECFREKRREYARIYYARHGGPTKEQGQRYHRSWFLRKLSSPEVARQIEETLPEACEACGSTQRLSLDHNHATGLYRGRLCHHCNAALGQVDESVDTLKALARYLEVRGSSSKGRGAFVRVTG